MAKWLTFPILMIAGCASVFAAGADSAGMPNAPKPEDLLGGDEGSACEMLLCLSNPLGEGLAECKEPLRKYFKIKPHRRPGYLERCPLNTSSGGNNDD